MSFASDKATALPIIQAFDCDIAAVVDAKLLTYDDLFFVLAYLFIYMECYPTLVENFTAAFDQTERESRGIYYNSMATLTDARIAIKCVTTSITYTTTDPTDADELNLLYIGPSSVVDVLTVDGGFTLHNLTILPAGRVKVLELSGAGTNILNLTVAGCAGAVGTLDVVASGAVIKNVQVYNGGFYGGYVCLDPDNTCAENVGVISLEKTTYSSTLLSYTAASESIRTRVYYRLNNTTTWYEGGVNNGDGVEGNYRTDGSNGFAFRGLQPDTYYDYKVVNICENGHASSGTMVSGKTASYIPECP